MRIYAYTCLYRRRGVSRLSEWFFGCRRIHSLSPWIISIIRYLSLALWRFPWLSFTVSILYTTHLWPARLSFQLNRPSFPSPPYSPNPPPIIASFIYNKPRVCALISFEMTSFDKLDDIRRTEISKSPLSHLISLTLSPSRMMIHWLRLGESSVRIACSDKNRLTDWLTDWLDHHLGEDKDSFRPVRCQPKFQRMLNLIHTTQSKPPIIRSCLICNQGKGPSFYVCT